ncbi:MAG TPA: SdpI family protein [Gemmatimonadaceae bacterium]|nr:SdpI family protein [Gemmatimonadaceae bacterium]
MRKWYPIAIVAAAAVASALAWARLPDRVPVHWNAAGAVDRYGSRLEGVLLMPLVMLGVALLIPLLPRIDPRGGNYARFAPTYHLVMNATLTFMLVVHLAILAAALGARIDVARVVPVAIGALLVVLGNVLPRTRPNWMFGIRTPWTLSNDRVWERTHRVGGYLLLGAGLVVALAGLLLPGERGMAVLVATVLAVALGTVVYSYVAWRQETRP